MTERRERPEDSDRRAFEEVVLRRLDEMEAEERRWMAVIASAFDELGCEHGLPTTFDSCSRCLSQQREVHRW